jgi:hypothetical protein
MPTKSRHLTAAPDTPTITADTFAARLSDKALHCRELGHTWRPLVARWEPESRSFHRRLRCSSCRTERVQTLNQRGHVVTNHYVYPDGYLATHVEGMTGARDLFRLEAVVRSLSESEARAVRRAVS